MTHNATVSIHAAAWASRLASDIDAANNRISISALSFLHPTTTARGPWPDLYRALVTARARGLPVEMFLAAPQAAHPATRQNATTAAHAHARDILVHLIPGPRLLHAKCCVIDYSITWIGSGNLTAAACGPNHELYVRIDSQPIAEQTRATLLALLTST